jgi:hypothetical protein
LVSRKGLGVMADGCELVDRVLKRFRRNSRVTRRNDIYAKT